MSCFIEFKNICKSYDGATEVIPNLNLEIQDGEFLTFLGASGSGKTTTLMMLAGFEMPSSGEILMNGKPIHDVPPHERNIGVVFQSYALFPHMTVAENLAYPLKMRGLGKNQINSKVAKAIEMVHLDGMMHRKPNQLSGGQQQRVALARALVFEPDLILMDEPLGALDKNLREHMQYEIKQIHKELNVTVVYVTHDQSEAMTMSDRIAVFKDGKIEQLDTPMNIYNEPSSDFIAGFVGENNLLDVGSLAENSNLTSIKTLSESDHDGAIAIRPEDLKLEEDMSEEDDIIFRCQLREKVYLGEHLRLVCDLGLQTEIVAKIFDKQSHESIKCGDFVNLVCSSNNVRKFHRT
ncbi:ABC transporter ATP-binding protein [Vibrio sp. Vb339]|uniref:ABC transporter ATP-binding protein n=1 Tax=Vibrio sp. Vb339 TaxID=1192013 RepID=UPI001555940A|nr:ABC transporter ATP-binding protein [Vibrio sp. Vb339]